MNESLDPRVKRLNLEKEMNKLNPMEYWPTYEVFHQEKRGKAHVHVGSVHASDPDMALVFAKEQYGRRKSTANMWVVKTSDIFTFSYDDEDMFKTTPEKSHREASGYKVRDKINKYKKEQTENAEQ